MTQDNLIRNNRIFEYLIEIQQPFTIDDLLLSTGLKKNTKNPEEILQMVRSLDEFVEENSRFFPKNTFLTDIPIRVQPTELELKNGILIPGHRLLPFYPNPGTVEEISLVFQEKPVKTKTLSLKMSELQIYFSLMDIQKVPIINVEDILEENADLEIPVYNLEKFYKIHQFKSGDTIIFKLLDLNEGIFSIAYDSYENYQAHFFEIEMLDNLFMSTLKKVMTKKLPFPNVEKQLLYTYYYLKENQKGKWQWSHPCTALGPLLRKDKEVTFSPLPNGRTIFHFVNQSPEDLVEYPEFEDLLAADDEKPDTNSIAGILRFLNNHNTITLVRALLFQQITNETGFNFLEIENYLFDGYKKPYMPEEFHRKLHTLLFREYQTIEKAFDLKYAYFPITTAREKILEQSLIISRFFQALDDEMVEFDELPKKEMMHLMELTRSFEEILLEMEVLQLKGTKDVSGIHRVIKIIEKTAAELPYLFHTIWEKLGLGES